MTDRLHDGMLTDADLPLLVDNAPKCAAGRSALHGYGLFAREPIEEGEVIVDFSSRELYREVPVAALEEWQIRGGKFMALSMETCLISNCRTKYSLVNHSRTPSAAVDVSRRVVFALRKISPGEEVTVDYRLEPTPERVKPFYEPWL
jgi:SET domain-containing protein